MLLWQRQGGTGKELNKRAEVAAVARAEGSAVFMYGPITVWAVTTSPCSQGGPRPSSARSVLSHSCSSASPQRASPGHSSAEHKERLDCLALATS